jgi:hypothetical protein
VRGGSGIEHTGEETERTWGDILKHKGKGEILAKSGQGRERSGTSGAGWRKRQEDGWKDKERGQRERGMDRGKFRVESGWGKTLPPRTPQARPADDETTIKIRKEEKREKRKK